MKMLNRLNILFISSILFFIDQITKYLVNTKLFLGIDYDILPGFLTLTLPYNTGAAFNIFREQRILLIFFSITVVLLLIINIMSVKSKNIPILQLLGISFLIGGAMGNLADRINYGYVIDFLNLRFINFPIFNFADVFINIGAILLIIYIFNEKEEQNDATA